jgi:hypothetical protein
MKTKDIICIVGFIIVTGMLLTGCTTTYQAYPGSALPRQQVAVLKWDSELKRSGSEITVDGNLVRGGVFPPRIALLPGLHTIGFSWPSGEINTSSSMDINVEAGKTYIVMKKIDAWIHNPRSEIGIQEEWSLEIKEQK